MTIAVMESWAQLEASVNGRTRAGMPGVRDPEFPCSAYAPFGEPFQHSEGGGTCDTDGHFMCVECTQISTRELRRRNDECADCGTKLRPDPQGGRDLRWCPKCDGWEETG